VEARFLIATLAVASLAAIGCGGDDENGASAPTGEATSTDETTTETSASAPSRVDLVTPPGDELVFEPDSATAGAGSVTLVWDNESEISHSICLEDAKGEDVAPGCSSPVKAIPERAGNITGVYKDLKPGEYTYYCDVDGHRAQGMEGTLTVE